MLRFIVLLIIASCVLHVTVGRTIAGKRSAGLMQIFGGRIVGGEQTTIEKFPYQVSIRYLGSHRCGASLVRPNFILTAAHCVDGAPTLFLRFVAGSSYRNSGGVSLYVNKVITHEQYGPIEAENDIALVKLNGYYEYSDIIQPIALASKGEVFRPGTKGVLSGWGTESEGAATIPVQLRFTQVYGVDWNECAAAYTDINPLVPGMICAGFPNGGQDSCQGDSGGPLVVGEKEVGIVSWGQGCARAKYPGVYTDVAFYRDWIEEKLLT